jgi:SpoVK/Ycf46/Vps4 family AAA+-type ATPase
LDDIKNSLIKESEVLLYPKTLDEWSKKKYGKIIELTKIFKNRYPLFIFAGDVGVGKTTLAETFGDYLARKNKSNVVFYKLSLNTRGSGVVGEMTKLISLAFEEIKTNTSANKKTNSASILLIDEVDSIAQSRELSQMHHEDRAGVNALIRGIDSLSKANLPIITIMCTNRLGAIDPAIKRRAVSIFEFGRPSREQRLNLFNKYLDGLGLRDEDFQAIANLTGENEKRTYGYTFSDITQKILPAILLNSYPDVLIDFDVIVKTINSISPTLPFNEKNE